MIRRTGSPRWHRALFALVLLLGHGTAVAATPRCTLPHDATGPAVTAHAVAGHDDARTDGTDPGHPAHAGAGPHDHAPDSPSVPGTAICAASMLAAAAPAMALLPPALDRGPEPGDLPIPPSTDAPPPFQPPRV